MLKKPKISIIMASYNYQEYIKEAINSVIDQTYKNWELLIIDDGSTDNSIETIQEYTKKHQNINLFQHPNKENKGLNETLKLGLKMSNGEYIAFLESDDYWSNDTLKKRIESIQKYPDAKLIFNSIEVFGSENNKSLMNPHIKRCEKLYEEINCASDISKYIPAVNLIPTFSCWMSERQALLNCNFNTPIQYCLDMWLWMQIAFQYSAAVVNERLTHWRIHSDSYSSVKRAKTDELTKLKAELFLKFKEINPVKYNLFIEEATDYLKKTSLAPISDIEKQDYLIEFSKSRVCIYGAGLFAKKLLEQNQLESLNIFCFIDGNINKKGEKIGKYKIFHSSDLVDLNPDYLIFAMEEPGLVIDKLKEEIKNKSLHTKIIPIFFVQPLSLDEMFFNSIS